MPGVQLELDLWQQLWQAQAHPQEMDWQQLCLAFDQAIERVPTGQRLVVAADAIAQMAELLARRAQEWFEDWQRAPDEGPILGEEMLSALVRQSMALDLEDLVAKPELYVRATSGKFLENAETVVEYRDKAEVLAELESAVEEQSEEMIRSLEHDEDVQAWVEAIVSWLKQQGRSNASLVQLQQGTGLSVVRLWLAGVLGELWLEQSSEFYALNGVVLGLKF